MNKQIPKLHPLTKIGLKRFLSKLETAPFVSRQYNVSLPELIAELLRIAAEVKQ